MATTALESVRKSGLDPSDIDLFIPHQANVRIVEAVAKGLDLPMSKMYVRFISGTSTNSTPYGVMNSRGPPDALQRVCGSSRSKFACLYSYKARAQGWKGTSVIFGLVESPPGPAAIMLSGLLASCARPCRIQ